MLFLHACPVSVGAVGHISACRDAPRSCSHRTADEQKSAISPPGRSPDAPYAQILWASHLSLPTGDGGSGDGGNGGNGAARAQLRAGPFGREALLITDDALGRKVVWPHTCDGSFQW